MARHNIQQQPPVKAPPVVADATLSDEQKDALAKAPQVIVPSIEEVKAAGYVAVGVAEKIVDEQKALAKAQEKLQVIKAYRVSSPREAGFGRIGRRFTRKPIDIPANALTEEQIKALVETPATCLTVEIIKG